MKTAEQATAAPDFVPLEWSAAPQRDVALDLLRGLAMVVLVVNHLRLDSPVSAVTSSVFSAAEVLVAVSGVVAGMVFGRRWVTKGRRATARMLLRRAWTLYVASVIVVAVVALLRLVPGLATDALTVSAATGSDLYANTGVADLALAIITLAVGPWQFAILGLFIALLVAAPVTLCALERGWWLAVMGVSWLVYLLGRVWPVDVLPTLSENVFGLLVWQLLFVHGMVLGWHRHAVAELVRARRRELAWGLVAVVGFALAVRLCAPLLMSGAGWLEWRHAHYDKGTLDPARLLALSVAGAAAYMALRWRPPVLERALAAVLLPLGRNSFYVFIMHVFVCLAIASAVARLSLGGAAVDAAIELGAVGVLVVMVRRRFLFRWVPR